MRGPLADIGGKRAIAKRIIDLFPKHATYGKAFAGSAQVFCQEGAIQDRSLERS
jgi:site-specific DNA-adenine methylase